MPDLDARRREALAVEFCKWRHPDLALGEASPVANHPDPRCRIAACFACQGIAALAMPLIAGWLAEAEAAALREAAEDFATGAWADAFAADEVEDDVSAVRSTERWLLARADRIGGAR